MKHKLSRGQKSLLTTVMDVMQRYPDSVDIKRWLYCGDECVPVEDHDASYPETYRNLTADIAGHICLHLGFPAEPEISKRMIPKKYHKHFLKDQRYVHIGDLAARILGGETRDDLASLFELESWPIEHQLAYHLAKTPEERVRVVCNRINDFLK